MKLLPIAILSLLFLPLAIAEEQPKDEKKSALVVSADGFPSGNATPEGAACDLARAFIKTDAELFKKSCIEPLAEARTVKPTKSF